jgi:hypothetical protein
MEDDFSVEKPRIARLTGPNYRPWSVQLQRLLIGQGLWNVASLGVETPIATVADPKASEANPKAPEPSVDRTGVKDAKASTIIMGLCAQSALQHILLLSTAKEQWDALKALYAPLGRQQLSAKVQAFTTYKPPESGATVAVVATDLSTLQYEIGTIDPTEKPSDTLKISLFLQAVRALDSRFDPLILQLEISGTATDYSTIVERLSEHERRMGPKEALRESALSAKERYEARDSKARGKKPFRGYCNNCGRYGHRQKECQEPESDVSDDDSGTESPETIGALTPEEPNDEALRGRQKELAQGALCPAEASW